MKEEIKKRVKTDIKKAISVEKEALPFRIDRPFKLPPKTLGQKSADAITKWAGSWTFIILVGIFLFLWMIVNTSWLVFGREWDPYPFILLNFILSTLAAIQAPIILMSQNREAQKDRARAEYDYAVNRKAEKEIREIRAQLDRIEHHNRR